MKLTEQQFEVGDLLQDKERAEVLFIVLGVAKIYSRLAVCDYEVYCITNCLYMTLSFVYSHVSYRKIA